MYLRQNMLDLIYDDCLFQDRFKVVADKVQIIFSLHLYEILHLNLC